jgi:hypothetical protein
MIFLFLFFLVIVAFANQIAQYYRYNLFLYKKEIEQREYAEFQLQMQRERAIQQLNRIRKYYEN